MTNFNIATLGVILLLVVVLADLGSITAELTALVVALGMFTFGAFINFQ